MSEFATEIKLTFFLSEEVTSGTLNRVLKSSGATLFYDVYGYKRKDKVSSWQNECFATIYLYRQGEPVTAQESVDEITVRYPFSHVGSENFELFLDIVEKLKDSFSEQPYFNGKKIDRLSIIDYFDELVSELMNEWGEEPGSETLAILIATM